MKRRIAFALALLTLVMTLTACSLNPLAGTWNTTIDGDAGQLVLQRKGVGQVISNGSTRQCTWTAKDGKLTVIQEVAGIPYTFLDEVSYVLEGKTLTVTSQSGNTLVFEKE